VTDAKTFIQFISTELLSHKQIYCEHVRV